MSTILVKMIYIYIYKHDSRINPGNRYKDICRSISITFEFLIDVNIHKKLQLGNRDAWSSWRVIKSVCDYDTERSIDSSESLCDIDSNIHWNSCGKHNRY